MEQSKACTKCGQIYLATSEFFHRHIKTFDGLSSRCKSCRLIDAQKYRQNNPEKVKKANLDYYHANKVEIQKKDKFKPSRQPEYAIPYRAEYYKRTAEKQKAASKKWRKDNPERFRDQWRKSRARILTVYSKPYTETEVLALHGTKCWLCGLEIDLQANRLIGADGWEQSLHLDHVIPIGCKGPDVLWNVQPTHAVCNMSRPKNGMIYSRLRSG